QQRHARDVTIVLAGLVGAAEIDLVELRPVDLGIARHQRLQRHRGEIVGAHLGERARVAADWCPYRVANEGFRHDQLLGSLWRLSHKSAPWPAGPVRRLRAGCKSRTLA